MTGRPDTWMPWYIGDYLADTMHLNTAEHGAYLLLIAAYWRRGKALPDDDKFLAGVVKASPKGWRTLRPAVRQFFSLRDGHWHHTRVEKEILRSSQAFERLSAAGKRGGRPKKATTTTTTLNDADEGKSPWAVAYQWLEKTLNLPIPLNGSRIHAWLAEGADLELDIKPVVARLLGRRGAQGPPSSLNYFDRAISESINARLKPLPNGDTTNGHASRPKRGGTKSILEGIAGAFTERYPDGGNQTAESGPESGRRPTGTDP